MDSVYGRHRFPSEIISQRMQDALLGGLSSELPSILAGVVLSWIYAGTIWAQLRAQGHFRRNLLEEDHQLESPVGRASWALPGAGIEPAGGLPRTGF